VNCRQFEEKLDRYLDGELDHASMPLVEVHIAACGGCRKVVTDHEKARALLMTAVADEAAAVDVSGLWRDIEAKLDTPGVVSLAAARTRRALRTAAKATSRTRARQVGAFTAVAAAAAVVFTLFAGGAHNVDKRPGLIGGRGLAQARPVRIDAMEVGAGQTVSTWVKPRTRTRIIWVASTDNNDFAMTPAVTNGR
jgi:anti-sigma factor RsiW